MPVPGNLSTGRMDMIFFSSEERNAKKKKIFEKGLPLTGSNAECWCFSMPLFVGMRLVLTAKKYYVDSNLTQVCFLPRQQLSFSAQK